METQKQHIPFSTLEDFTGELLTSQKTIRLYVGGSSMYPHLKKGDYATVEKTPFDKLRKGDVVVFKGQHKYVAHRLIKYQKINNITYIITKGDSLKKYDSTVSQEMYRGQITAYQRKGKHINLCTPFQRRYATFLAFISPYTPVIYSTVRFFKHLMK